MIVAVVQVRQMRMGVPHRLVHVLVEVRLGTFVAAVGVLMMFVVDVAMSVSEALMLVFVRVVLREDQPGPERHQHGRGNQARRERLAEERYRERQESVALNAQVDQGHSTANGDRRR